MFLDRGRDWTQWAKMPSHHDPVDMPLIQTPLPNDIFLHKYTAPSDLAFDGLTNLAPTHSLLPPTIDMKTAELLSRVQDHITDTSNVEPAGTYHIWGVPGHMSDWASFALQTGLNLVSSL